MSRPLRAVLGAALAGAALALVPAPAGAEVITSALGIPCASSPGVAQQCTGSLATRVPTWDGVPLDVNLAFPPPEKDGPFPLVVGLHGWPLNKEASVADADPVELTQKGYAVLTYSSRGFGLSCGVPASRVGAGCARGWVHLGDARYEGRDTQHLAGLLADQGLIQPQRIAVTGSSYGGGQSFMLAVLRDRVMKPDGSLTPWRSPQGKPMRIAAAAPRIGWTDLTYALVPNGDTLDFRSRNDYGDDRTGVPKESWIDSLYNLGNAAGFYAPPGADPGADIRNWYSFIRKGDPYDEKVARALVREFKRHRSSYYLQDLLPASKRKAPAPLLAYNAWTDDIFPASEPIRLYNRERDEFPKAEFSMIFADGFGHPRAALTGSSPGWDDAREAFFARYLLGKSAGYRPAGVVTHTQGCEGQAAEGPFKTRTWHDQHRGQVGANFGKGGSFDQKGGDQATADAVDPNGGETGADSCRTVDAKRDPAAANYELKAARGSGYTLMGSPTVALNLKLSGRYPQIQARLWDVAPGGDQTLVTRGAYSPEPGWSGERVIFQLHPNGWRFRAGHVAKLELLGRDSPYGQASNTPFKVTVSKVELQLPVRERPDGKTITAYAPPRLRPQIVARTKPKRDRSRPFRFKTSGRIVLPKSVTRATGCRGRVGIRLKRGGMTLSFRRARVRSNCRFSSRARLRRGALRRMRVKVGFAGNELLEPRRARTRRVRAG